jgi:hypothetical protein
MFQTLAVDDQGKNYFARFDGTLTAMDLAEFDLALVGCRSSDGFVSGLLDFTGVIGVELTTEEVVSRGKRSSFMGGHLRVIVANGLLFGLMRMYATHKSQNSIEPVVVRTLSRAYEELGLAPQMTPELFNIYQRPNHPGAVLSA